jgi:integrase
MTDDERARRIAEEWRREESGGSVYASEQETVNGAQKRWIAQFRAKDHAGKVRTYRDTRSTTKKQAQRALLELKKKALANKQVPVSKAMEPQTFAAYIQRWHQVREESGTIRPNTAADQRHYMRMWVELMGEKKIREITTDDVELGLEHLKTARLKGKHRSIQQAFRCLRKALADVRPRLPSNPCDAVDEKPKVAKPKTRAFTPDELMSVLKAVDEPAEGDTYVDETFATLVVVLAHSGMRVNEALGLTWADIDFNHSHVHIRKALVRSTGQGLRRMAPKTETSARKILVGALAIDRLKRLRGTLGAIPHPSGFVFQSDRGTALESDNIRARRWHPLLVRAGIEKTGFHILRHTFASLGLQAGVDVVTISRALGHASVAVTMENYAHFIPGREQEAADAVAQALSGKNAS